MSDPRREVSNAVRDSFPMTSIQEQAGKDWNWRRERERKGCTLLLLFHQKRITSVWHFSKILSFSNVVYSPSQTACFFCKGTGSKMLINSWGRRRREGNSTDVSKAIISTGGDYWKLYTRCINEEGSESMPRGNL